MSTKLICRNKKAHLNYAVEERYEAGLVLVGSEVKSLRDGRANLKDSYAVFHEGELYLLNAHISPWPNAGPHNNHEPNRSRKLLMHKKELKRLTGKINERGYSLIPLSLYFKGARAKAELGLGKGKRLYDRRQDIKRREHEREMARAVKRRR